MKVPGRRAVRVVGGLAISVLFVVLLLRQVDITDIGKTLARLSPLYLVAAISFLATDYLLRIVRWWWMLRALGAPVSVAACTWPFLVSIAVNNLLPFRAGDVLRVVGFRRNLGAPAMTLLGTVAIERLFDLMTLLLVFFLGLVNTPAGAMPELFVRITTWLAGTAFVGVCLLVLFAARLERLVDWLATRRPLIARSWAGPIRRHSSQLLGSLRLLRTPRVTLLIATLSVAIWILEGCVFATVAEALDVKTALAGPWFAMGTGTLATLIPSSPGYLGTFDYFASAGLVAFGAERVTATTFALTVHLVLWLPLTLAGIIYFVLPRAQVLRQHLGTAAPVRANDKST